MGWSYLMGAVVVEILATTGLHSTEGFTQPIPTVGVLAGYLLSFFFLSKALRSISLGVSYALWSAIGTASIAVVGVLLFGDAVSVARVVGLICIVAGVVTLNMEADRESRPTVPVDARQSVEFD
ncbi:QacE family quaternary ammonium compound efflux SMR transporter (plasmid) [Rhodococcus oxybenzonivorans]|uniref:Multidrug resistance protein Mmr n=1 Tax=Rhodococcus oxybenzonivorans TaxID=1990687 RepID=A0A2S2C6U0_9NOCA|nr:multidrug efflux SMR transporter [Rhodococcus oxybenzonivorans]AWK76575.1 QacE family quaternary ammonium compound efflux SMR transporter [Rhodococcus oxybenzonivorans]